MNDQGDQHIPNAHLDAHTRLVGLLGYPVEHSVSPQMQNAAFLHAGLNYCYVPLPTPPEDLAAAVAGLRAMGFVGWNVTIPHKQAIMALLDDFGEGTREIGAVNTVVVRDGRLTGYNTDVVGFMEGLYEKGWKPGDGPAGVLGAGGSARGVVWALANAGSDVTIFARRVEQAEQLANSLQPYAKGRLRAAPLTAEQLARDIRDATVLVNCTPAGMWPRVNESPLPEGTQLPARLLAYDLVYKPVPTRFLTQAASWGCPTQTGLPMLVHQGAAAFRLWTGQDPDLAVTERAVLEALAESEGE